MPSYAAATSVPEHHPSIAAIEPTPQLVSEGFLLEFPDILTRTEFVLGMPGFRVQDTSQPITPLHPTFDEEYVEWVDVFEAVAEGTGDFVMAEIGAGFGRWLVRGAMAARRQGRPFRGIAVEAEPDHFRWLKQHCRDNGVAEDRLDLVWAAVDTGPGFVAFAVGRPDSWYGQGLRLHSPTPFPDTSTRRKLKARSVLGRPPVADAADGPTMWVPCVSLPELLAPYPRVDLVDIDVQGLELSVIESAVHDLDERVRRLHVGTHSPGVERRLRVLLARHGWTIVHDYPSHARSMTPYGEIDFDDGVQTWINPRLEPGDSSHQQRPVDEALSVETGRVKRRSSRTAILGTEVMRLNRLVERLRQKNATLKGKLAAARRKVPRS
jgi:FkbM family methyltransferase